MYVVYVAFSKLLLNKEVSLQPIATIILQLSNQKLFLAGVHGGPAVH